MEKIIKGTPPVHIVVVDTNILWHEDKSYVINPDFDMFWDQYSQVINMKLIIPEVVRGELLFQQTTSALKSLNKANNHINKISVITEVQYLHKITADGIKNQVTHRFDKWLKTKKGEIESTPIHRINWEELIHASIWRLDPFSFDAKNPDNEKGFRDSLILETLIEICHKHPSHVNIAFICNDGPLRKAVEKRLKRLDLDRVSCYESLDEFSSYIKLIQEELTEAFIKAILFKAQLKFYKLMAKEEIFSKIVKDYEDQLNNPPLDALLPSGPGGFPMKQWISSGTERLLIIKPQFKKIESKNVFHWKSGLLLVRPFKQADTLDVSFSRLTKVEQLRILHFSITWSAKVRADGRFYNLTLREIKLDESSFKKPTLKERREFGLSSK